MHTSTDPRDVPEPAAQAPRQSELAPRTPADPAPRQNTLAWIPIRSLGPGHRPRILEHLLALDEHDRYLRFGYAANDPQIERYVDGIDLARDDLFGVFNHRLSLVALAHLAYDPDPAVKVAEYGVSVSTHMRGRGFGKRLFAHAILFARNRGIDVLQVHALSENQPMLRIAAGAGAHVERAGSEAEACLRLPAADAGSRWEAWLETHAAGIDYSLKQLQRLLPAKSVLAPSK